MDMVQRQQPKYKPGALIHVTRGRDQAALLKKSRRIKHEVPLLCKGGAKGKEKMVKPNHLF
jgi:hypothetical protein